MSTVDFMSTYYLTKKSGGLSVRFIFDRLKRPWEPNHRVFASP